MIGDLSDFFLNTGVSEFLRNSGRCTAYLFPPLFVLLVYELGSSVNL